ncbi:MAG: glycoside hydrolase family 44 protein [Terracidiphilus sp.]
MRIFCRLVTLATVAAVCLWIAACGSSGGGGTTTGPAPSITSFTASPAAINSGQSSNLTGVFTGGTGVITPGSISATSGTAVSVSPIATTTYTLTVTATNGTQATSTATVTINPPPAITSFTASPATITAGGNSSLTAVFTGGTGVVTPGNISVTSGTAVSVSPTTTTTYTLTVSGSGGPTVTSTATVTVVLAPAITSFVASPTSIAPGASSDLTAVFTTGGAGDTGIITPGNLQIFSGLPLIVSPTTTTTYTLTVTNAAGTSVTKMVTVNVVPPPAIASFTASPATITAGGSSSLNAVFSGGTGVVTPGNITVTSGTAVSVSPTSTTTYTLTVTNAENTTATATTTVTVNPAITSFTANPATITAGGSSSLTGVFSGGTGVVTPGNITVTSGTAVSVSPTSTTTYTLTVTNAENTTATATATVTVNAAPAITVTPSSAVIGKQVQFTATASNFGTTSTAVTWTVSAPSGSSLSPGDISSTGLYNTPYPAPPTVTVTATSTALPTVSGSVSVTLSEPGGASGPALTVDAGDQTHAISPYIYGWNGYASNAAAAQKANITIDRFGGDATSLYNYQLDVTNAGSDWYFQNGVGNTGQQATSQFNEQVIGDAAIGAKTLGTMPVEGYIAKDGTSCSYTAKAFPQQYSFDPYDSNCGDGMYPEGVAGCTSSTGCNIPDPSDEATVSGTPAGPTWDGGWVAYLVQTFGTAANGGVFSYDLDNEPAWWDGEHRDVHPNPSSYDEVTNNGIATAQAVKTADPTAHVNGPVVDYWWNYFYSKKDIESGWNSGIGCYQPWSNPVDREAHGGVPFIEYYLQQFNAASTTYGARLLDYLDLHTYFAGTYNGNGVGLTTAGDTQEQEVRLNSTRVLWDPTYTDPNYPQPNYTTDPNYTTSCNVPLQAPQLIPMAQAWVAKDYPGTKIAFTEFNWGGQENVNGAVAQADILGIFGKYGLDLATLWGPPDPTTQVPGLMAYEIYRNYDGANSMFGDTALNSNSANQAQLSVYGALRSKDNAITVVVINKTYGPLTATLSLENFTSTTGTAQAFQYSNANINAIVAQPTVTVTPPSGGGTTSTISYTFPTQSITLFVVPN